MLTGAANTSGDADGTLPAPVAVAMTIFETPEIGSARSSPGFGCATGIGATSVVKTTLRSPFGRTSGSDPMPWPEYTTDGADHVLPWSSECDSRTGATRSHTT